MSMIERRDLREQKQCTAPTPNINTVFAYNVLALVAVVWVNITNNINVHVRMFICARDINVIRLRCSLITSSPPLQALLLPSVQPSPASNQRRRRRQKQTAKRLSRH